MQVISAVIISPLSKKRYENVKLGLVSKKRTIFADQFYLLTGTFYRLNLFCQGLSKNVENEGLFVRHTFSSIIY
jgi:hypothetical protein